MLLVVTLSSEEIDASFLEVTPEYCENLGTNRGFVFASGHKNLELSSGWHHADSSSECLGPCFVAHLPASSPGHCSIVFLTRAHLFCL